MPIAHIYCTESPLFIDTQSLAVRSPTISEFRGAMRRVPTDFTVLESGTFTDITPPCFAAMVAEGSVPDNRYMADVEAGGESAAISVLRGKGTTQVRHMSMSPDGYKTTEHDDNSSVISAEHPELIIGHSIETLGRYIGGLLLHLPERKLELFKRTYGAKE